jgi:SOUL heme-binding protein
MPPYHVTATLRDGIEIRRYEERLAAEVALPQRPGSDANDAAFRILFDYITGANQGPDGSGVKIAMTAPVETRASEKIAMTAPVVTADTDEELRMQFFLPARYDTATAPRPTDDRVRIVSVPAQELAVLRFTGAVDATILADRSDRLQAAPTRSSWRAVGDLALLRYDAPFTIPFLRRNEIAVAVELR